MIEITLNELYQSISALTALSKQKIFGKSIFLIAKLMKEVELEVELFENARRKVLEKYADKDAEGKIIYTKDNRIKVKEDLIDECNEELSDLAATQVKLDVEKIPKTIFDSIELSPQEAYSILAFIEE